MAKILVTGGAGYIGTFVTEFLLEAGHDVVVLDKLYYGAKGMTSWQSHPRMTFIEGDVCSIRDVVKAIKGVSAIIALAAIVGDPACELSPDETLATNYEATKILVELAKYHRVPRIVFASSCSVYGSNGSSFLNEGSWLNPVSLYAETRIMSEKVLLAAARDLEVVILRLATVFGASRRMRYDLVANILVAKAMKEGEIAIYGKDQWRPLLHVQDAARAFVLASQAPEPKVNGQIFNVGSNDQNFTIGQIGEAVRSLFPQVNVIHKDVVDRRDYRVDFSKIASLLGYQAGFNLESGLREMKVLLESRSDIHYLDDIYYNVKYLFRDEASRSKVEALKHGVHQSGN